uniref:Uncharacterized protein n=1 Tax=Timema cristinae TaxID=61476 RepID=A0A7R9DHN7_TIMCR|nr:unnamed protein product [Timema cristinae]
MFNKTWNSGNLDCIREECCIVARRGYTKTVVAASVSAQKYNPELTWSQRTQDIRIAQLSDKLRHIRQVVLMQLTQAPESESYMRDEEGSGSGHPPVTQWADDEDQNSEWVDQGSGSGDDDTTDNPIVETPRHRSPSTEAKVPVEQSSTAVDSRRGLYAWTLVVLPLALSRVLWYG